MTIKKLLIYGIVITNLINCTTVKYIPRTKLIKHNIEILPEIEIYKSPKLLKSSMCLQENVNILLLERKRKISEIKKLRNKIKHYEKQLSK
jgi:hypothetical protein